MCMCGMPYKKPTTVAGSREWVEKLSKKCEHKKHEVVLSGGGPGGKPLTQLAAIYPERLGKAYADLADRVCGKGEEDRAPRAGHQDITHENAQKQGVRVPSSIEGTLPEGNRPEREPAAEDAEALRQADVLADLAGHLPENWDQAGLQAIIAESMKLLGISGTMEAAAYAYRKAFSRMFGNHIREANLEHVKQVLGADHFAYLRKSRRG